MWQNTFTPSHLLELPRERERLGTRRAGSNLPGASWKDFQLAQAPTRVGEGKVRSVNRVAKVGVSPVGGTSCNPSFKGRIYWGGGKGVVCSLSFSMKVSCILLRSSRAVRQEVEPGYFLYMLSFSAHPNFPSLSVSKPGSRPHTYLGYIILCAVPLHVPMGHPYLGGNTQNVKVKGQCHEFFDWRFFFMNQFPQAPEYPIRADSNFSKICGDIRSSRCTTCVVDKWKNLQSEKFSFEFKQS